MPKALSARRCSATTPSIAKDRDIEKLTQEIAAARRRRQARPRPLAESRTASDPTKTSSRKPTKAASTSQRRRTAPAARISRRPGVIRHGSRNIPDNGCRKARPSCRPPGRACAAHPGAEFGLAARMSAISGDNKRAAGDLCPSRSTTRPRPVAVLEEDAHVGIADAIGARQRPFEVGARRRHDACS